MLAGRISADAPITADSGAAGVEHADPCRVERPPPHSAEGRGEAGFCRFAVRPWPLPLPFDFAGASTVS